MKGVTAGLSLVTNGTGQTKKICNDCEGEGRIKVLDNIIY